jgi:hypothetical protein
MDTGKQEVENIIIRQEEGEGEVGLPATTKS